MTITISEIREIELAKIIALYKANQWSSADKPEELYKALTNSHSLVSAWHEDMLIGIGNAISDGYLVVYYPHLLVHPDYQGKGIGKMIMNKMQEKYGHFHMQMLTADGKAINFYNKIGFERAGQTQPMWIYKGDEH
ncbi:GNAT family N-acetyltransferase [Mongoliibacter ruber]|uniref:Ribosomal protein S18 acetylase RimI-like enzyme n=1 Tax=Mongoliibacter ruber TaxID=1750599 RepID=A0A2T0WVH5_9BACT|nr:GNAT family N-acetyltransferase [Mongoliibacter ruber]PRY90703.1 ribosomal protein S18 acetylase RimI-like enzyme [Mongoliibacter ruber]